MRTHDRNNWNRKIIEEFHANGGKVGGPYANATLLLLTSTGAKSGQQRINPLWYMQDGERLFIFASRGGEPTNPDWYYNIVAHPEVAIEVGTEKFNAKAVVITGKERDEIYEKQAALFSNFDEYQKKTSRIIPVVELVRQ
jgi:deazaflavin-dependent oxidoreductase (nitroreductase family)